MRRALVCVLVTITALATAATAQEPEFAPVKPALIVIDIQNKYIPMMDESETDMALRVINALIWQFRRHELPIFRVYHTNPQHGPEPGTEDFEFPDTVNIEDSDPKVVKNYPSAFMKTELDEMLKEEGVNTVFLCGLSATGCVLASYFGALEREYDTFLVEGALMSPDAEHTETIKDILDSVTWGGLDTLLRARAAGAE
jgi:nicotinamidase-related amidase